ncbi:unnamed protein product [Blepharisma stoltei]|uniref:Uncharacterized protein n=1 Tax=Blepharisma stoltei TaxID=1481888 RepID=A0AAU9JCV2_9CILI|nr:unnamed protein product [Blepharisma stoltei]
MDNTFKLFRKPLQVRSQTEILRTSYIESEDDSPSQKPKGIWTKMQNSARLKLLAAGFLKSAFPSQNLKKPDQIPHIKYRNSVFFPEGTQILLGICQSQDFNNPFPDEKTEKIRQSFNPAFIEMICKTNIRRSKSKLSKVWNEDEEEREFLTEREKVISCITGTKTLKPEAQPNDTSETNNSDKESLQTQKAKKISIRYKNTKKENNPSLINQLNPISLKATPSPHFPMINQSSKRVLHKSLSSINNLNVNIKPKKKQPAKVRGARPYHSPYENILIPITTPKN